jgi:ferredoxin/flavodoxin---NADP+ reductase
MAKPLIYNATLTERIDLTDALTIFKITPDEPPAKRAWFVPGQYCVIGMNNEKVPELGSVRRAMSIASAPEQSGPIEFYIRYVSQPESENPLTHLLWTIKDDDRLYMRTNAAGKFTVPHTVGVDDPRLRIMVAAGTGAAPFVSIVRSEVLRNPDVDLSKYVFLHGASYAADLGYRDELLALSERNGLRYFGTVSRPGEASDWSGDSGRVEDYFKPERLPELEERLGLEPGGFDPTRAIVLICGLQGTIGMCIHRLLGRGFIPEHRRMRKAFQAPDTAPATMFYEQYDNTPVVDIDNPDVMNPLREALAAALARTPELVTKS